MKSLSRLLPAYAFCHFAVDFVCVASVVRMAQATQMLGVISTVMLYDLLAFCLQLPIGAALDQLPARKAYGPLSLALVAAGATGAAGSLSAPATALAAICAALGNALFHCDGGVRVLDASNGKAAPSGIFISTGAFGVFLGSLVATTAAYVPATVAALAAAAVALAKLQDPAEKSPLSLPKLSPTTKAAALLLCMTIALRSYAGMVMAFPWKSDALAWFAIAAVVCGKAAGGVLADRRGLAFASVTSLGGAAALFPLSWQFPAAGIAATLLFNFTMPITLIALWRELAPCRGLAFGLASFSLAIGALPALMGVQLASPLWLVALSCTSLATLLGGLALAKPPTSNTTDKKRQ